jgi:hypothetical protein
MLVLISLAWVRIIQGNPAAATVALEPVDGSAAVASGGVDGMHAFLLEAIARTRWERLRLP